MESKNDSISSNTKHVVKINKCRHLIRKGKRRDWVEIEPSTSPSQGIKTWADSNCAKNLVANEPYFYQ